MSRYLLVINSLTYGGAEAQAVEMARMFKKSPCCNPIIIALFEGGPLENLLNNEGIEYRIFNFDYNLFNSRFDRKLKQIFLLAKYLHRLNPDFIITSTIYPNIVVNLAQFFLIKKIRNYWYQVGKEWSVPISKSQKLAQKLCYGFLANSNDVKEYMVERLMISSEKINVITNVPFFRGEISSKSHHTDYFDLDVDNSYFRIVVASNFFEIKDQLTAIKAINILLLKYPKIQLILAGFAPEPNYLNQLKAFVLDNKIQNNIVFLPSVEDVSSLLRTVDLGLFTSVRQHTEGSPTIIMEYMQAGLPVIVSDIKCNREILADVQNAIFYEPENEISLADCIDFLLNNAEIRIALAMQCRRRAECFVPNLLLKQLKEIGVLR
jgi:glycosyltransferase involved in cell wall biosynthesis